MINLYNGDCLEVMKNIPDNSVDLIITSPPCDAKQQNCLAKVHSYWIVLKKNRY